MYGIGMPNSIIKQKISSAALVLDFVVKTTKSNIELEQKNAEQVKKKSNDELNSNKHNNDAVKIDVHSGKEKKSKSKTVKSNLSSEHAMEAKSGNNSSDAEKKIGKKINAKI